MEQTIPYSAESQTPRTTAADEFWSSAEPLQNQLRTTSAVQEAYPTQPDMVKVLYLYCACLLSFTFLTERAVVSFLYMHTSHMKGHTLLIIVVIVAFIYFIYITVCSALTFIVLLVDPPVQIQGGP